MSPNLSSSEKLLQACDRLSRCLGIHAPIRVLMVEDEPGYCAMFKILLLSVAGTKYTVDVASDLETANRMIATRAHDIYVIDLTLAGFNGIDLVKGAQEKGIHFPFIILTGSFADDRVAMGRDCMMWLNKDTYNRPADLDKAIRYAIKNWKMRDLNQADLPPTCVPDQCD